MGLDLKSGVTVRRPRLSCPAALCGQRIGRIERNGDCGCILCQNVAGEWELVLRVICLHWTENRNCQRSFVDGGDHDEGKKDL